MILIKLSTSFSAPPNQSLILGRKQLKSAETGVEASRNNKRLIRDGAPDG